MHHHEGVETVSDRIAQAFRDVPRARFLPAEVSRLAGDDVALPIGHGQTNSQPSTVARMLELLDVHPGDRVLDVGSGSGWTTALLAHVVGPQGRVLAVERVPELVSTARTAVADFGVPPERIHLATPGVLGLPEEAPFDRILVSAMGDRAPVDLFAQLSPGGVLVGPWRGLMNRARRLAEDDDGPVRADVTTHGRYSFVPLVV